MSKAAKITSIAPRVNMMGDKLTTQLGVGWSDKRRGSRHARGYGSTWDKTRVRILKRDQYLCQCEDCKLLKRIRPASEVDHIVNKAEGGTDADSNLQAINKDCHKAKTQREQARATFRPE